MDPDNLEVSDSLGVLQPKSVLIVDDHSAHYTKKVKEALAKMNTKLIIIPGGLTPKAQIMDVLYNRPFKHRVRLATDLHRLRLYKEKKAKCSGGMWKPKCPKLKGTSLFSILLMLGMTWMKG